MTKGGLGSCSLYRTAKKGTLSLEATYYVSEDRVCQHWFNLNLLRRAAYDDVTVVALFATTDFVSSCEQLNSVQNSA